MAAGNYSGNPYHHSQQQQHFQRQQQYQQYYQQQYYQQQHQQQASLYPYLNPTSLSIVPEPASPPLSEQTCRSPSSPTGQLPKEQSEYLCLYSPCADNLLGFARKADLQRHMAVTHDRAFLQPVDCRHPGCHRRGDNGFTRKDKMIDHMRDVHRYDIEKKRSPGKKSP